MDRYSDMEQLAFVFEEANIFLITLDEHQLINKISTFAADVLCLPADECIGKHPISILADSKNAAQKLNFQSSLDGHQNFETELVIASRNYNLITKVLRDSTAEIIGHALLGIDVTAVYHKEDSLIPNYQLNGDLLAQSVLAQCFTDLEGTFVEVNQAYCDLFEVNRDDIIGKDFIDVHCTHLSPDEKEQIREASATTLNRGQRQHATEIVLKSTSGKSIQVEVTRKIIRVNGYPLVSASLVDVTSKKQILKQFTEQNLRLRELAFLSSNKLRQPLTNIIGLIQLVKSDGEHAQNVTISPENMGMLTKQLDNLVAEMGQVISDLDIEVGKNLLLAETSVKKVQNIWLVDDDQVIAYITQRLINNADPSVRVNTFLSAKLALEKLKYNTESPDILLLDINMPGINGWQFLDELRAMHRFINVYMYSSSIDPEDINKARSYPMVRDFLAKPIDSVAIKSLLDIPVVQRKVS
jgi:PAS domain S-box-containing protein